MRVELEYRAGWLPRFYWGSIILVILVIVWLYSLRIMGELPYYYTTDEIVVGSYVDVVVRHSDGAVINPQWVIDGRYRGYVLTYGQNTTDPYYVSQTDFEHCWLKKGNDISNWYQSDDLDAVFDKVCYRIWDESTNEVQQGRAGPVIVVMGQ